MGFLDDHHSQFWWRKPKLVADEIKGKFQILWSGWTHRPTLSRKGNPSTFSPTCALWSSSLIMGEDQATTAMDSAKLAIIKPVWDFPGPQPPTHRCLVTSPVISVEEYLSELVRDSTQYYGVFMNHWPDVDCLEIQTGETQKILVYRYQDREARNKKYLKLEIETSQHSFLVPGCSIHPCLYTSTDIFDPAVKYRLHFLEHGYSLGCIGNIVKHEVCMNLERPTGGQSSSSTKIPEKAKGKGKASSKRPPTKLQADKSKKKRKSVWCPFCLKGNVPSLFGIFLDTIRVYVKQSACVAMFH